MRLIYLRRMLQIAVVASSVAAEANDDVISAVTSAQTGLISRMKSVDFVVNRKYEPAENYAETLDPKYRSIGLPNEMQIRFREEDGRWRTDVLSMRSADGPAPLDNTTFAYDGKHHQRVYWKNSTLYYHQPDVRAFPYGIKVPLFDPYQFAYLPDREDAFGVLSDPARWADIASRSRLVTENEVVDGIQCVVLEIETPFEYFADGIPKKRRVYFSQKDFYYPIRTLTLDPKTSATLRDVHVVELRTIDTDAGPVVVPMDFTIDDYSGGARFQRYRFTIDPGTLNVNANLDDAAFTVSPFEVGAFVDEEHPSDSFSLPQLQKSVIEAAPTEILALDGNSVSKNTDSRPATARPETNDSSRAWRSALVGIALVITGIAGLALWAKFKRGG